MYVLEHDLKGLNLAGKQVLTLIQSINQPMVAAADYPAEATQAYIVTSQASDQTIETFIFLHLTQTNQCVIYRYGEAPMMIDRMEDAEGEALDFVESMGFIMDNLRYHKASAEDRRQIEMETPIFYPNLDKFKAILEEKQSHHTKDLDQKNLEVDSDDLDEIEPGLQSSHIPEMEMAPDSKVVDVSQMDAYFDNKATDSSTAEKSISNPKATTPDLKESTPPPWEEHEEQDEFEENFDALLVEMHGDVPPDPIEPAPKKAPPKDDVSDLKAMKELEAHLVDNLEPVDKKPKAKDKPPAKKTTPPPTQETKPSTPNKPEAPKPVSPPPATAPRLQATPQEWQKVLNLLLVL